MTSEGRKIPDKWFIIPIILLGLNFIYRLIDQSKMIFFFPLDYTNDISSWMANLFFLGKCGFFKFCPYWYNGFITFKSVQPGWYLFTYPIYFLTKNVQLSIYLSMILIFALIFITIYFFGKLNKFSNIKIIAFFLLLFANAVAIGNFIRLGRPHELFAWLNFIIIAFTMLWYKDNKITNKIYLLIFPLCFVILTHPAVAILSFLTLFSLFIIKNRLKDKIKLALISIISLIITSFWWIQYVLIFKKTNASDILLTKYLFIFDKNWFWQNIATFIIPIIFCTIFYFYWVSRNKSKKELLFFAIPLLLAVLLFFRVVYFIPFLKYIYPDVYIVFLLFFSIFLLLKLDINIFPKYIKKLIPLVIFLAVIVSILFSIFYTPFFITHSDLEKNTLNVLNKVDGKFLILKSPSTTSFPQAYYSYAPIYLNLTTSNGWHLAIPDKKYNDLVYSLNSLLENKKYKKLNLALNFLNTTNIITYNKYCSYLEECGLKQIYKKNEVCLYKTFK